MLKVNVSVTSRCPLFESLAQRQKYYNWIPVPILLMNDVYQNSSSVTLLILFNNQDHTCLLHSDSQIGLQQYLSLSQKAQVQLWSFQNAAAPLFTETQNSIQCLLWFSFLECSHNRLCIVPYVLNPGLKLFLIHCPYVIMQGLLGLWSKDMWLS